jgi:hypothetical protein
LLATLTKGYRGDTGGRNGKSAEENVSYATNFEVIRMLGIDGNARNRIEALSRHRFHRELFLLLLFRG